MGKQAEADECKDCHLELNENGVADCIYKNEDCKICPRLTEEIKELQDQIDKMIDETPQEPT